MKGIECPLCISPSADRICEDNGRIYYHCGCCDLRFLDPSSRLGPTEEKARYLLHQNDINDPAYRAFVKPLHDQVLTRVPKGALGLDFGSGTGPVLADMLRCSGFDVNLYDPFFAQNSGNLELEYDFIVASEVIEHLFDPRTEFGRLKALLRAGGLMGFMTSLYGHEIDFACWHYRRDPTHVAFYSQQSFQWICAHFGFSEVIFPRVNVVLLRS